MRPLAIVNFGRHSVATSAPMPAVTAIARAPQNVTRMAAHRHARSPDVRRRAAQNAPRNNPANFAATTGITLAAGSYGGDGQGHDGSGEETRSRCQRRPGSDAP